MALAAHRASFEQRHCTPDLTGSADWVCTWKCALRLWPDLPRFSNQMLRYLRRPEGLEDASCYPALAEGLARRGFDEAEVDGILGGNMRRVFAQATGPGTRAHGADLVPIDQSG